MKRLIQIGVWCLFLTHQLWAVSVDKYAVSTDKKMLALAYESGDVRLYSLVDGKLLQTLRPRGEYLELFFFAKKDTELVMEYEGKVLILNTAKSSKKWRTIKLQELIETYKIPNKYHLDPRKLPAVNRIGKVFSFEGIRYSVANKQFLVVDEATLYLWDENATKQLATIKLKGFDIDEIKDISFSPDGKHIAVTAWLNSDESEIFVLDAESYAVQRRIKPQSKIASNGEFISNDLLLLHSWYPLEVWSLKEKKIHFNFTTQGSQPELGYFEIMKRIATPFKVQGSINGLDVNAKGEIVMTGNIDQLGNRKLGRDGKVAMFYKNAYTTGYDVRFSPDGSVVAFGYHGEHLVLYDSQMGKQIANLDLGGVPSAIRIVKFAPSGHYIAAGSDDGIISIIDMQTLKRVKQVKLPSGVFSCQWMDDETVLAGTQTALHLVKWKEGEVDTVLESGVIAMDAHRDAQGVEFIVLGSEEENIKMLNAHYQIIKTFKHTGAGRITLSQDGKKMVSGSESETMVWDLEKGTKHQCPELDDSLWAMAYDERNHRIYTAGDEGRVFVWNEQCKKP